MSQNCDLSDLCPFKLIHSIISSSETGKHFLNAKKEILLAFKSLIEKEIEIIDGTQNNSKTEKVEIK
jgi:hypothetical protein